MNGTTLCPHCNTRFRIAGEQLEAHQGMVRCGHCMQAFDARPGFIPDRPDPQLELPIADRSASSASPSPSAPAASPQPEVQAVSEPVAEPVTESVKEEVPALPTATEEMQAESPVATSEEAHDGSLDFVQSTSGEVMPDTEEPAKPLVIQPIPLAGAGADEDAAEDVVAPPRKRRWPWIAGSALLCILLLAQALYFFRIELAARLPGLKPVLVGYCGLLGCSVPLPQKPDLMSIESSELEADPEHENQIVLVVLLRNRATHVQAFPVLELSLNDTQDKVLARRLFKPADYLPATETEAAGLRPNRELNIRLRLDTTDLRPTGYRLALFYPQ
jgi:predicted Zn finger-like uncharacterized protein